MTRAELFVTGDDLVRVLVGPSRDADARPLADRVCDYARRAGARADVKDGSRTWIVEVEAPGVRRLHDRIADELERVGCEVERDGGLPRVTRDEPRAA